VRGIGESLKGLGKRSRRGRFALPFAFDIRPLRAGRRCPARGGAGRPYVCMPWKARVLSCGEGQRKLHDRLFSREAVQTENVSYLHPVSFGGCPTEPSNRLGDLLWAVHPSAQFLGLVLVHDSHPVNTAELVCHPFSALLRSDGNVRGASVARRCHQRSLSGRCRSLS